MNSFVFNVYLNGANKINIFSWFVQGKDSQYVINSQYERKIEDTKCKHGRPN